jgi:sugar phosphate permease
MFIIEGLPAIIWAFFWWQLVDDTPRNAKWLSEEDKDALENQLNQEQQGIKPVKNYATAFKSGIVILLCLQYALWSIGVYGFVMWLPSIINGGPQYGHSKDRLAFIGTFYPGNRGMIGASYFSDKRLSERSLCGHFF